MLHAQGRLNFKKCKDLNFSLLSRRDIFVTIFVMRTLRTIVGLLILFALGAFVWIVQPGPSGVVASLRLPEGSQYMVTQICNWGPEPYTVSFYMRSPGGGWSWCYIDHQANRWQNVTLLYDTNRDVVTITERGTWRGALDRKRGTFAIGDGRPSRDVDAPQMYSEPPFAFP
jgi:hypothetical protein